MNDLALPHRSGTNRLADVWEAVRRTGAAIGRTCRLGARTMTAAPLLVAVAMVPEFLQHVAEIRLGMFDSIAAARALADDHTRWLFGYAKVAGFTLAILLVARFWATGSVRGAILMRPRPLLRAVFALGVLLGAGYIGEQLIAQVAAQPLRAALSVLNWVAQMGLTVWFVAALVEDEDTTLRLALTRRLPRALLLFVLLACAFIPAQALHLVDHRLALGQPAAIVWALMVWDTLIIGLMTALLGSALWVGSGKDDATARSSSPGP